MRGQHLDGTRGDAAPAPASAAPEQSDEASGQSDESEQAEAPSPTDAER